jgi:hypothetical protein
LRLYFNKETVRTLVAPPPRARRAPLQDEAAEALNDGGFMRLLAAEGLFLWRLLPLRTRAGTRIFLTVSLPPGSVPALAETNELDRRVARARPRLSAAAARLLALREDAVELAGAPLESCCGSRCEGCLLGGAEKI